MSSEPETVIRTWFEEVWNQRREAAIDRLFAPEGVVHGLPGGDLRGPGSFKQIFQTFSGAFPDIHITVERTMTDGEYISALCRVQGTHTGPTLGMPATGKRVDFQGITMGRVSGGQIQEGWNVFDFLAMYQQLGVAPPAA